MTWKWLCPVYWLIVVGKTHAFVGGSCSAVTVGNTKLWQTKPNSSSERDEFLDDFKRASEKMGVEKTRQQLEDANTQSFLKRKPVKLKYEDARRWVQANLGCDTREEFEDLVENGNLRTPYIPKRPEEYYTATREWISWDHFLRGIFDDSNPSSVGPATGIFD